MVGKKQNSNNEDWLRLYDSCIKTTSKAKMDWMTEQAINDLKEVIHRHGLQKIGFLWSGGKDSIVMYDVLRRSGVPLHSGLCVLHQSEYPSYEEWLLKKAPPKTLYKRSTAFSLEYLNKHTEYLFPVDPRCIGAYTSDWWKEQREYYAETGVDVMVAGRRTIDGNFCPRNKDGHYLVETKSGMRTYNIIANWTHEELLAYIRHNGLMLPQIYFWPNGFRFGTHQWTERRRLNGSYYETFDEIMMLEPSIVVKASEKLSIARRYFEDRHYGN